MADKTVKIRLVLKHDTEENWVKAANFIPKQGEVIIYDKDDSHTYTRVKVGDGTTKVNDLPFITDFLSSQLDELKPTDQGGSGSTTGTAPTVPAVAAAVSDGAGRNIQDTYIEEVQTASAEDVSGVLNAVFGS